MKPNKPTKGKVKKQHTVWHWTVQLGKNDFQQVGVIHNNKNKVKEDIIRVRFKSSKPGFGWDAHMRVDEALSLSAGINRTLLLMIYKDEKHNKLFIKSAKLTT